MWALERSSGLDDLICNRQGKSPGKESSGGNGVQGPASSPFLILPFRTRGRRANNDEALFHTLQTAPKRNTTSNKEEQSGCYMIIGSSDPHPNFSCGPEHYPHVPLASPGNNLWITESCKRQRDPASARPILFPWSKKKLLRS